MKNLEVGRRRFNDRHPRRMTKLLNDARQNVRRMNTDYRQGYIKMDRVLMLESNLFAFARALRLLRFLGLAVTIRVAAAFDARQHEKLFARDATAPHKRGQQQQRKKRTGKGSAHVLLLKYQLLSLRSALGCARHHHGQTLHTVTYRRSHLEDILVAPICNVPCNDVIRSHT